MYTCMYIFINEGLGMSAGKIAAQSAHAGVEAFRLSQAQPDHEKLNDWLKGGHYTKIVLSARGSTHLLTIDRYLRDRSFETALIIDEGRTEIPPHSPTALGVEIVDKDDPNVKATFSTFDLMKDKKPKPDLSEKPDIGPTIPEKDWGLGKLSGLISTNNIDTETFANFALKLIDNGLKPVSPKCTCGIGGFDHSADCAAYQY